MAAGVYNPSLAAHLQECLLHAQDVRTTCLGIRKRLGGYCGKNVSMLEPGFVPHCRIHNILQQSSWCRATLSCGFECGRICEWKPQGFQICTMHQDSSMPCYFLTKIPAETRCRIYALLLPDQTIPACWRGFSLTSDQGPVHTAILRVNKLVYEEAIHLLYSIRTFTILLANSMLTICNSARGSGRDPMETYFNNTALDDYQMQLRLLEQQNRRRLILARNQQVMLARTDVEALRLQNIDAFPLRLLPTSPAPISTASEPVWDPPLQIHYFNQIQFFHVEVSFPPKDEPNGSYQQRPRSPVSEAKHQKHMLYEYCDILHELVARFLLMDRNLQSLEVVLKFERTFMAQDELISAALILLRPFQRLRKVVSLRQPRVLVLDSENQYVELVDYSKEMLSIAEEEFQDYLKLWVNDLNSTLPSVASPIFQAYWRLKHLSRSIRLHPAPEFEPLTELLHTARVAREANDLASLQQVWKQVTEIWNQHVIKQALWTKSVQEEVDGLGKIILDGIAQ